MARDGLLPKFLGAVHPRFRTPWIATLLNGLFVAVVTGLLRLNEISEMTNIGTLSAFIFVALGVWILRIQRPDLKRGFTTPALPLVAIITIVSCAAMMYQLDGLTWSLFGVWSAIGVVVYFSYGVRHSTLHHSTPVLRVDG
jgi:APA family basic amino acid/polyamine antiporter